MIDILFTHSYFQYFDPKEWKAGMPYPPLGTITGAAFLRSRGYSVALHDVMLRRDEEEIRAPIRELGPRLVVIYDDNFNYLTKMCLSRMREAALRMAAIAKSEGCLVAVFSSDAPDHLAEYFRNSVDFVLCGEAEETLAELAGMLFMRTSTDPADISGIAFRRPDGTIAETTRRPPLADLDALPRAAWDLVDLDRYRDIWIRHHGFFSLNLSTTRGCPFHCNWCAKPLYGQVYHARSPENVVAEMKYLKEHARPDHVWITDDIFGLRPGWIAEFDRVVNREDAVIPFKCLSRADLLLKEDSIRHLRHAGCHSVWIGAESGSQKILDAMEKGTTVGEIEESTRLLRKEGIHVGYFLQFGYPGETMEDIEETIALVRRNSPDEIGISVSYPLPGTGFFERVKAGLSEKQNWETSDDFDPMFPAVYSKEFYRTLHTVVHKRFRIWRGIRAFREFMNDPLHLNSRLPKLLASMVVQSLTLPGALRSLRQLEQTQGMHVPA